MGLWEEASHENERLQSWTLVPFHQYPLPKAGGCNWGTGLRVLGPYAPGEVTEHTAIHLQ